MRFKVRSTLLGACIMTAFAVVSTTPAFAAERPVVKTTAVTSITADSATFNGEVNPEGLETKYYFEYGVSSYEKKTAEYSAGSGTSTLKKSVAVTGLLPGVTYKDVRIVATNSNGTEKGAAVSFKTEPPEFTPANKQAFTSTGSEFQLSEAPEDITCKNETTDGNVNGAYTVDNVAVTFTGCTWTKGVYKNGCPAKSRGGAEGEILTVRLKGQLGVVSTKEAASGVGLVLEPNEGSVWTTLAGSECSERETQVSGKLALEVEPIGAKQLTGKFTAPSARIKELTLASGETVKVKLTGFDGLPVGLTGIDDVSFSEATEVT